MSIRRGLKKIFRFCQKHNPDILCLQEVKAPVGGFTLELMGYDNFGYAKKAGTSGTVALQK